MQFLLILTHISNGWSGVLKKAKSFCWPLSNHAGGYILFKGDNASEIQHCLQDDPFIMHNIADAEIMGIEPALCAQGFPEKWAEKARFI
jgi:hypothetical protein